MINIYSWLHLAISQPFPSQTSMLFSKPPDSIDKNYILLRRILELLFYRCLGKLVCDIVCRSTIEYLIYPKQQPMRLKSETNAEVPKAAVLRVST